MAGVMSDEFIDSLIAAGRRAGYNTGLVLANAAKQIGTDRSAWVKAATQLYDIAFLTFMEITDSATQLERQQHAEEIIQIPAAGHDRLLELHEPLRRLGSRTDTVPENCVSMTPRVLPAGTTTFRLLVEPGSYPSGLYRSRVSHGDGVVPVSILL
jgi:hypothetical protein